MTRQARSSNSCLVLAMSCAFVAVCVTTGHSRQAAAGQIGGRVIDGSTGGSVLDCVVTLIQVSAKEPVSNSQEKAFVPQRITTEASGTFLFHNVPPGQYQLSFRGEGIAGGGIGVQTAADLGLQVPVIELGAQENLRGLVARVWRYSRIRGTVLDDRGEPVVRRQVQAFKRGYVGGRIGWVRVGFTGRTDDRGSFECSQLTAGEYLAALMPEITPTGIGRGGVFYGGSARAAEAIVIPLGLGEERSGIDIVASETRARGVPVSGQLSAPGQDLTSLTVHLVPQGVTDTLAAIEELRAAPDATGRFLFPHVPVGEYDLESWLLPKTSSEVPVLMGGLQFTMATTATQPILLPTSEVPTWSARRPLVVTEPVEDVELLLQPAARIRGRVVFAGGAAPPREKLSRLGLIIRPAYGRNIGAMPLHQIDADGTFRSIGLPAGEYQITIWPVTAEDPDLNAWRLASVQVGGREVASAPFDVGTEDLTGVTVTLAQALATISGVVRNATNDAVPYSRVIVFPQEVSLRAAYLPGPATSRVQQTTSDIHGRFNVNLLPGNYVVVAAVAVPEFWMAPDNLQSLVPRGTAVTIGLGEARSVALTAR